MFSVTEGNMQNEAFTIIKWTDEVPKTAVNWAILLQFLFFHHASCPIDKTEELLNFIAIFYYRPRSEGDNVIGSVRPSVCVCDKSAESVYTSFPERPLMEILGEYPWNVTRRNVKTRLPDYGRSMKNMTFAWFSRGKFEFLWIHTINLSKTLVTKFELMKWWIDFWTYLANFAQIQALLNVNWDLSVDDMSKNAWKMPKTSWKSPFSLSLSFSCGHRRLLRMTLSPFQKIFHPALTLKTCAQVL